MSNATPPEITNVLIKDDSGQPTRSCRSPLEHFIVLYNSEKKTVLYLAGFQLCSKQYIMCNISCMEGSLVSLSNTLCPKATTICLVIGRQHAGITLITKLYLLAVSDRIFRVAWQTI